MFSGKTFAVSENHESFPPNVLSHTVWYERSIRVYMGLITTILHNYMYLVIDVFYIDPLCLHYAGLMQ